MHNRQPPHCKRMRDVRGDRTLAEIAKSSKVSASTWSRCEQGGMPNAGTLVALCRNERINLNWLLAGIGTVRLTED